MTKSRPSITLQHLIDDRTTVTLYCDADSCRHWSDLDLVALRDRLGPEQPMLIQPLRRRFRCGACGGREISMIRRPFTVDGRLLRHSM